MHIYLHIYTHVICIHNLCQFLPLYLIVFVLCIRYSHIGCISVIVVHSVMSDSVTPWTSARQASLSFTNLGVCSNSCPLSQWCHPTISSSVIPFFSHLQSCPASGSFLVSQLFESGGQSIDASASASVLPINIQEISFRIDLFDLLSKGLSRVFSTTTVWKHQFFGAQPSLWSNFHIHTSIHKAGKTIALTRWTFVGKVMSLLFNTLSLS